MAALGTLAFASLGGGTASALTLTTLVMTVSSFVAGLGVCVSRTLGDRGGHGS